MGRVARQAVHYRTNHVIPQQEMLMRSVRYARQWLAVSSAAAVVLGGGASALAASSGSGHARRVQPPAAGAVADPAAGRASASATAPPGEFATTADPVTLDPPVKA